MNLKLCPAPLFVLVVFVASVAAETGGDERSEEAFMNRRITAVRIDTADSTPVIDGVLDDRVWQDTAPSEDLHQISPVEFAPPTEHTRFRVAYDADNLYIAVQLDDREPDAVIAL